MLGKNKFNKKKKVKFAYVNNTNVNVAPLHMVIMEAIANGGIFSEDFSDIFTLTKTPIGSRAEYVLDFSNLIKKRR